MGKNAILTVSFGTSHADTREKTIGAIEEEFRRAYPGWEVRRAFTSRMIIRSLAGEGIQVDTVPQALEKLAAQGLTLQGRMMLFTMTHGGILQLKIKRQTGLIVSVRQRKFLFTA